MEDKSLMKRDSLGNFAVGNQEGQKFQPGNPGKPKGTRHRKTIAAKQFAEDVLHLNPETGEQMTYEELTLYIARKADQSPRILNLLIDHLVGKPLEKIQVEPKAYLITAKEEDELSESNRVGPYTLEESKDKSEDKASLPEGE